MGESSSLSYQTDTSELGDIYLQITQVRASSI